MTYSVLIAAPLLIAAIVMAFRFVGCTEDFDQFEPHGDGDEGPPKPPEVWAKASLSGSGQLSADASFPSHPENDAPPPYTQAGMYTYEIPYWCSAIDVLLLGAGGGGSSGGFAVHGGLGGSWTPVTFWRGFGTKPPGALSISAATPSISITVGAGGSGGATPGSGGDTVATVTGLQDQTASGGAGGANSDAIGKGPDPHTQTSNNQPVTGGDDQTTGDGPGNSPGGAGAGGFFGGAGADGAAWVVARQT
jgi:hypothetical protein